MRFHDKHIAFLFFCFFLLFISSPDVLAQQGAGVKIIPASIEQIADPNEVIEETLSVTNISGVEQTYFIFSRNIQGVGDGGVPIFAEFGDEATQYELSEWISFESDQVTLASGEEVRIPIRITIPENASPGSHFGGVFISVEPPRLREIGAGVGYDVASIISLRISGDVVDNARIRSFSTNKLIFGSKDVDFLIKVENQGNILIRPRGPLSITNMFGGETAVLTVNDTIAGVFPGVVRDFNINWTEEEPGFGQYKAIVALIYDGEGGQKTIDATVTFWIFPSNVIIPILVGLLILFGLIFIFVRLYIRSIVARTGNTGRRVVARQYRRKQGVSPAVFVIVTVLAVVILFLLVLLVIFA